jgi:hypothetical protein
MVDNLDHNAITYFEVRSRNNTLDEVCTLQIGIFKIAVSAICSSEVGTPKVLQSSTLDKINRTFNSKNL